MALFAGTYENRIDRKGRVSLPADFRAELPIEGNRIVYVYPSPRGGALEACDRAFMQRMADSLEQFDMFSDEEDDRAALDIVNNTIDLLFFIDILVIFFSAFYDDEQFRMVEDYSEIAINYLTGWFLIDTVSILPFDLILNSGANPVDGTTQVNGLVRFMKIGRLYKLLKLTKLMRILNVVADRRSILKYLQQML